MNPNRHVLPRCFRLALVMAVASVSGIVFGEGMLNVKQLDAEVKALNKKLATQRTAMIDRFNKAWKTAGDPQLPIDAEEFAKDSGFYKLIAGGCPKGTGEVIAQVTHTHAKSASGTVTTKATVSILGTGGEVGAEVTDTVSTENSVSVQAQGCLVLDEATRFSNDSKSMWRRLSADLKQLAPIEYAVQSGNRVLGLHQRLRELEKARDRLLRARKTPDKFGPRQATQLREAEKNLEAVQRELSALTAKLRETKQFQSIR